MSEEQKILYPVQYLSEFLRKAGLPYSKPSILRYEKDGVIRPGVHSVVRRERIDRLYTEEEIGQIAKNLRLAVFAETKVKKKKKAKKVEK